jgi:HlyD family secretion protein
MTARVDFLTKSAENVIRVPNAALRFRPATTETAKTATTTKTAAPADRQHGRRGGTLYVLDAKGQPQAIRVQTGITDGTLTAVTGAGITDGTKVIVGTVSSTQQETASKATPFQSGQQQQAGGRGARGGF